MCFKKPLEPLKHTNVYKKNKENNKGIVNANQTCSQVKVWVDTQESPNTLSQALKRKLLVFLLKEVLSRHLEPLKTCYKKSNYKIKKNEKQILVQNMALKSKQENGTNVFNLHFLLHMEQKLQCKNNFVSFCLPSTPSVFPHKCLQKVVSSREPTLLGFYQHPRCYLVAKTCLSFTLKEKAHQKHTKRKFRIKNYKCTIKKAKLKENY